MNIGDYNDVQSMNEDQTEATLKQAFASAKAGQPSPKSWRYWRSRLNLFANSFQPGESSQALPYFNDACPTSPADLCRSL
jgi:hypothetical protein